MSAGHRLRRGVALLLACAIAVASVARPSAAQKPDPRTQPAAAIAEAIRLLEGKEYARFLETFSRPGDLTEMLATRKMDDLVAEFASERSPDILAALKAASGMPPTVSQDGLRVDYRFEKPFGREKRISMVKIGEYWYFR